MNLITQKELWGELYGEVDGEVCWKLYWGFNGELYWALRSQIRAEFLHSKISRV